MGEVIYETKDMTYLNWTKVRHSSGTAGSFLKAYEITGSRKTYYKLSNYDAFHGIIGHECINEIIADRLLTYLKIPHLSYSLLHARVLVDGTERETFLCASSDFKREGEGKIALDTYYQMERIQNESPLAFCIRQGWESFVYDMLLIDYLILNRDRHGANIELLRNPKERSVRPAPLFDHGLSLVFQCVDDKNLSSVDVLEDKKVQCFVGSQSARANLDLIPKDRLKELPIFDNKFKSVLFEDLDTIQSELWIDTIWSFITKRAEEYEDIRDKRRRSE